MKRLVITLFVIMMFIPNLEAKTYSKKECKQYAYNQVMKKGWTLKDYNYLVKIINRESKWNANAYNKKSGACGISQANPCSKMKKYGRDYKTNCKVQLRWALDYIKNRYKTPSKAFKHIKKTGWY